MSPLGRAAIDLAKWLPRGYWPLLRVAATLDPALRDVALPLASTRGLCLRADLRESVYAPILRHGCIPEQRGQDRLYRQLLRSGERVLDAGANVGYTALVFADAVGPAGQVYAFEPSQRIHALLERSVRCHPSIQALRLAVTEHTGTVSFFESSFSNRSSTLPIAGVAEQTVPCISVDDFCSNTGLPTFIKIDVEGSECAVLMGANTTLNAEQPPIIAFEALDAASLERCIHLITRGSSGRYSYHRILDTGELASANHRVGTSDYLALPAWAGPRLSAT